MHAQLTTPEICEQRRSSVLERDNLIADAQYRFLSALPQPVTLGWEDVGWSTEPLSREFVRNFNRAFYTLSYLHEGEWRSCPIDDFTRVDLVEAICEASLGELRRLAAYLQRVICVGDNDDRLVLVGLPQNDGGGVRVEDETWRQMRARRSRRRKRTWDR